jgi:hypothetical protein
MVHFRLDPEKFLSLDEAWKLACSRCAELACRIDELSQQDDDLNNRRKKLNRQGHALGDRITDNRITDDERAAVEAELDAVVDELAVVKAKREGIYADSPVLIEKHAAEERRIERLMRDALADGPLDTWIEGPDGQPKPLRDREAWRQAAFGFANIASVPEPVVNPGPDTRGKPAFVEKPVFENWLDALQRETGASGGESPAVAGAAESLPDEPPVSAAENTGGGPRKRGPKAHKLNRIIEQMRTDIQSGQWTRADLENALEKNLASKYSASRSTVRDARNEVCRKLSIDK